MLHKLSEKLRSVTLKEILEETRWIYQYTARYRKWIFLYILLGMLVTVTSLGGNLMLKAVIDAVSTREGQYILWLCGGYLLLQIGAMLLQAVASRMSAKVSIRAGNEIRRDVFQRFLDVQWEASLGYHSGDLLSRVNSDVATVAGGVLGWLPSLVVGAVRLLAALAVMLVFDPVMALIALLAAPSTIAMSRVFVKNMRVFGQKTRDSQAKMVSFYEESLQNLQAVKAFDLKRYHTDRLEKLQKDYEEVALEHNAFSLRSHLVLSVAGMMVSCLCLGWGVYRMWSNVIGFGTMVLFVQLAGMVSGSFSSLVSLVPSAISATVSAGRIMAILKLPMEDDRVSDEARQVLQRGFDSGVGIRAENVCFAYEHGEKVFDGMDLYAASGEIIGIISPSGGGKTTLLRMLLGLIQPQGGNIRFRAGDCEAELAPCLRPLVTYVAQDKVIFSGTVEESLRLLRRDATDEELDAALKAACAWDFVSRLPNGKQTVLGERGAGLSEGQNQRLAIARALVSRAPVLLLDEATSALDFDTERRVLKNILRGDRKRTVVVTTHRPAVLNNCSRVYAIRDGKAVELTKEEIREFADRVLCAQE